MAERILSPKLLARFGIFVQPDFLDKETCARVTAEMLDMGGAPATTTVELSEDKLDEAFRRTTIAEVSPPTVSLIEEKLLALESVLEESFSSSFHGCEQPQFLLYREGDYIRPHSDGSRADRAPGWLRDRSVSVVVFLNDQSDEDSPRTFGGGALTFYGLLSDDERGQGIGIPVTPRAGLLVAFPADVVHAVPPVTRGERCTAVTWFLTE